MDVPVISLETVYHVGTLDPAERGCLYSRSYEGAGISVSLCPDAWRGIARLGGSPLFALHRRAAVYVDLHALKKTAYDVVVEWAVASGLAGMSQVWLARFWDVEDEAWRCMELPTRSQAVQEALSAVGIEFDDHVDETEALARASALWRRAGHHTRKSLVACLPALLLTEAGSVRACGYGCDTDGWDIAAMFWAEDVVRPVEPDVVGVWWRERYSPDEYSSPRGAVFPSALDGMLWSNPSDVPDDDHLLRTMPRTRRRDVDIGFMPSSMRR